MSALLGKAHVQMLCLSLLLAVFAGQGCAPIVHSDSSQPTQIVDPAFQKIALLPVKFVSSQPDSFCHADIGDDLRRSLSRKLRARGYLPLIVPDRRPQSFLLSPPVPEQGTVTVPDVFDAVQTDCEAALDIWVEHYMATGLCEGYGGGNTLEMHVTVILYSLATGEELGRWRAKEWATVSGSSLQTVWSLLERLTDKLLVAIPNL
ncbi:MAG: hypothetical protein JRD88_03305 [Deltaproteobacteria bacterium]|jgi:hypothetical protein|nr:hypothetical protein [Deltaproteobacteria bacterium]